MSTVQYKRCNDCGAKNDYEEEMCIECFGTSFTLVSSEPSSSDTDNIEYSKNEASKMSIDQEDKTVIESPIKILKLLCDGFEKVINDNDIVGRQAVCSEHIQNNKKISRQHAKFNLIDNEWHIEDLGSTNGTYVDNVRIAPNQKIKILDGFEVKFSSTLVVRVLIGNEVEGY